MKNGSYKKLLIMLTISFCVMYGVMFLNVDQTDHIFLSLTRTYMSLLMISPMALLMIIMMPMMYPNKFLNITISCLAGGIFILSLIFLRSQTFIGDREYMEAMIPHHSSAIMTSKHAALRDPEVKNLSDSIIKSQEREIRQMKEILQRINKNR